MKQDTNWMTGEYELTEFILFAKQHLVDLNLRFILKLGVRLKNEDSMISSRRQM